jgi:hypothetical protein
MRRVGLPRIDLLDAALKLSIALAAMALAVPLAAWLLFVGAL